MQEDDLSIIHLAKIGISIDQRDIEGLITSTRMYYALQQHRLTPVQKATAKKNIDKIKELRIQIIENASKKVSSDVPLKKSEIKGEQAKQKEQLFFEITDGALEVVEMIQNALASRLEENSADKYKPE